MSLVLRNGRIGSGTVGGDLNFDVAPAAWGDNDAEA